MAEAQATTTIPYEISIDHLTYTHREGDSPSLSNVTIHLPKGPRTILVGANGGEHTPQLGDSFKFRTGAEHISVIKLAGKSTLLQILAGKRLISSPGVDVRIKGRDVFRQTPAGITFLGTEWCGAAHSNHIYRLSVTVDSELKL